MWQRRVASPPSPDGQTVYAELRRRYDEPFRQYHNLRHILDCLRLCDEIGPLLVDRDAVEIALWFHDAVYDSGASTNELRSAELFLSVSAGASFMFRHRVCDHILATRHSTTVRDPDRRFLVDIDLSGFGAPWDEFMRNGALLREECCDQDDVRYHYGQVAFLSRLQERQPLSSDRLFSCALRDHRARQPAPRARRAAGRGVRHDGTAQPVGKAETTFRDRAR